MKKVLIITYYWPPSGGSGVQRWLKFVKYLPDFNVKPHVYTPLNPDFSLSDESFLKEIPEDAVVIKKKIVEPYGFYRLFLSKKSKNNVNSGKVGTINQGFLNKLAVWVRGNVFIPDPRVFWVNPSYRFLVKYLKENNIKTVITSGPPHSMHLIGLKLKKKLGKDIQWIADFRDPWTKIYNIEEFRIGDRAFRKIKKIEEEVILNCDKLITVSQYLKSEFEDMGAKGKSYALTNGFDHVDFKNEKPVQESKFLISYLGFFPEVSNPSVLWKVLRDISLENKDFKDSLKLRFIGTLDNYVKEDLKKHNLIDYCEFVGVVKHKDLALYFKRTQVLLLTIANVKNSKGILTGKIFEYLASKRPVLGIGDPNGDARKILKESGAGELFSYEDYDNVKLYVLELYEKFKNGKLYLETENVQKYTRKNLTKKLIEIIEN